MHLSFTSKPWRYEGTSAWFFATIPKKMSKEIRQVFKKEEQGWGRLKVTAYIGSTKWQTSIWFDTKLETYLLPLKSEIRKKENIVVHKNTTFKIKVG